MCKLLKIKKRGLANFYLILFDTGFSNVFYRMILK